MLFIFGVAIIFGAIFLPENKATLASADAASTVIGELWDDENDQFDGNKLKEVAKNIGYNDIQSVLTNQTGAAAMTAVELSNGGDWSVTLGNLVWNPVYLSTDDNSNLILTLWLASTASANSGDDVQEVSSFSDYNPGGYSSSTFTYTEFTDGQVYTVYSNSYSGSYLRNYLLNRQSSYVAISNITRPAYEKLTKFLPFTDGDLADYIVAPKDVSWQMAESSYKNDPSHSQVASYPNGWTNDKIWLPSNTEADINKLWNTSQTQRANSTITWLRSGYSHSGAYIRNCRLTAAGESITPDTNGLYAIRPALHLNLKAAADNSSQPTLHIPQDVEYTYDGRDKEFMLNSLGAANTVVLPDWFDAHVTFSYEKDNVPVTELITAGEYAVTITADAAYKFETDDIIEADYGTEEEYLAAVAENERTRHITLTINKRTVFVSAGITASGKIYDGTCNVSPTVDSDDHLVAIISDMVSGDDLHVSADFAFENKNAGIDKTVFISNMALYGDDADNYFLSEDYRQPYCFASIAPIDITVEDGDITAHDKVYDGTRAATFDISGVDLSPVLEGEQVTLAIAGTFNTKDVGTNKAVSIDTATLAGMDSFNYKLIMNQSACVASITPKPLTVTIASGGGIVGGTIVPAKAILSIGYFDDEEPPITLTYKDADENVLAAMPTDVGVYTVTASIPEGNYYLEGPVSTDFVILMGGNEVMIFMHGWEYGDDPVEPELTAALGVDTAIVKYYKSYEDGVFSQEMSAPTSALAPGTYYATVLIPATNNYSSAEDWTSFTVDKCRVKVSGIKANNKTYDATTEAELVFTSVVFTRGFANKPEAAVTGTDLTVNANGSFNSRSVGDNKKVTISDLVLSGDDTQYYTLAIVGQQKTTSANIIAVTHDTAGVDDEHSYLVVSCNATHHTLQCEICGDEYEEEHEFTDWVALEGDLEYHVRTCTAAGCKEVHDSTCADWLDGENCKVFTDTHHYIEDEDGNNVFINTDPDYHFYECEDCGHHTEIYAHEGRWQLTKEPTSDEEGERQLICETCGRVMEIVLIDKLQVDHVEVTIGNWTYGEEPQTPHTNLEGTFEEGHEEHLKDLIIEYYTDVDGALGEKLENRPVDAGKYWVKATFYKMTGTNDFEIYKREATIKVTPPGGLYNVIGDGKTRKEVKVELENAFEDDYTLSVIYKAYDDDNNEIYSDSLPPASYGVYFATVTPSFVNSGNYVVLGENSTEFKIVKRVQDTNGLGLIDFGYDWEAAFRVTGTPNDKGYGLVGSVTAYTAQIFLHEEGDRPGFYSKEFSGYLPSTMSFKVPENITKSLIKYNNGAIDLDLFVELMSLYTNSIPAVDEAGNPILDENGNPTFVDGLFAVEDYKLTVDDSEALWVTFAYDGDFKTDVVFNLPTIEPEKEGPAIPWWVWLLVGLLAVAIIFLVVVLIMLKKRKGNGGNGGGNMPENVPPQPEVKQEVKEEVKPEVKAETKPEAKAEKPADPKVAEQPAQKAENSKPKAAVIEEVEEDEEEEPAPKIVRRKSKKEPQVIVVQQPAQPQPQFIVQQPPQPQYIQPQYVVPQPQYVVPQPVMPPQPQVIVAQPAQPKVVVAGKDYDDAELKELIKKQSKRLDDMSDKLDSLDGGFNDPVDPEDYPDRKPRGRK